MPSHTYTAQQIEDVRKKMYSVRGRLKTMLRHVPGGWNPSVRLDENFWTRVAGRNVCLPHCRIRVLRQEVHGGKKSCPVWVEWIFPVGKILTVDEFVKSGRRALRHWRAGLDGESLADDIRDMQDASIEIPKIVEMMPHIARLCHPDPLVNMAGEGGWNEVRRGVRKKKK